MSLCRSLQKLQRIRLLQFQPFHKAALACQQQDTSLLRSEDVRPCALPGPSRRRTAKKTELSTLPGPSLRTTDNERGFSVNKDVRHAHPSKPPRKAGPGTMAKSLVTLVMGLSDVKEEVYGALDEWAAFEVEFPLVATRNALDRLRQQEQWHRIIQVTKWMFSKGIGKTHGAYSLLLKAYCMEGRLDEAGELWDKLLTSLSRDTPKNMFFFMAKAYQRREMPEKVVEVFEQMESFGMKPDKDLLRRAEEAYQQLNMPEKGEQLGRKYALDSKTRRKEKRLMARKTLKASKLEQRASQADGDCDRDCQADDVKEKVEEHTSVIQGKQTWASSSIEQRVSQTDGDCDRDCQQTNDDKVEVEERTTVIQGKQTRASFNIDQRVIQTEGSCNTDFQTDDDEDNVKEQAMTIQGKQTWALSSTVPDRSFNRSEKFKRFKEADTTSANDEFVEQVIASMSQSSFRSVKGSKQM